ncbi:MAG TPA: hypothetical protein VD962_13120 [Rubricoccaceae bacterium]|nr:hypothetical protein [Rubricoccaceae bacterium]
MLAVLLGGQHVAAQETRLDVQVTYVAGANAYLDAGAEAGLVEGDTLEAFRAEQRLGTLRVLSVASQSSIVTFAGAPFSLTRGDQLTVTVPHRAAAPAPVPPPATPPAVPERPSILQQPTATRSRTTTASSPRMSGRLQVGSDLLQSRTVVGEDLPTVDRTFATPFAALRASVDDLPAGLRLDVNARASFRYAAENPFDRPADLRLYQLSLEKSVGRSVQLRGGRFYNEYDRFSGYWDGALVHVGSRARGVGVAAGLQPDRADELPSGDLPKYTVFAHGAFDLSPLRTDGTVLAGQILPRSDTLRTRTFFGIQQRAWARGVSLSAEALVDQDPETDAWALSRASATLSAEALPGVRLFAQALRRRPYLLFGDTQALLPATSRISAGGSVTFRRGPLPGATLRADVANAWTETSPRTLTFGGGLNVPRLPALGVGVTADATTWQQENRRGVYGGFGVSRAFGTAFAQVGYRYGRTPLFEEALVTHGLDAVLQFPITRRLTLTGQAALQNGARLSSMRLYTALWYRL